jgi:hypothetical protein
LSPRNKFEPEFALPKVFVSICATGRRLASVALQSQFHYLRLGCDWEDRATAAASRSPVAATLDPTGRRLASVALQSQFHYLRLGCGWLLLLLVPRAAAGFC